MNEECEQQQQHSSSNNNNNNNNRSRQTGKAVTILYISFHFKLFTKKLYSENRVKESVANIIHTTVNNKMFGWCVMCVCVWLFRKFFFSGTTVRKYIGRAILPHTHIHFSMKRLFLWTWSFLIFVFVCFSLCDDLENFIFDKLCLFVCVVCHHHSKKKLIFNLWTIERNY